MLALTYLIDRSKLRLSEVEQVELESARYVLFHAFLLTFQANVTHRVHIVKELVFSSGQPKRVWENTSQVSDYTVLMPMHLTIIFKKRKTL